MSVATLISATVGSLLIFAVLAVGRGIRVREAIALRAPTAGSAALWMAVTAGLIAVSDALTWSLDKPIVPEFMSDLIRSATIAPLLWLAIIVAAPVFEELFFRGFLIEGLRRGALGDAGAIVVTSLSWASIHLQYGWSALYGLRTATHKYIDAPRAELYDLDQDAVADTLTKMQFFRRLHEEAQDLEAALEDELE